MAGFVEIWAEQLNLNFEQPPLWNEIKNDLGPHLKRLPDELLPAIGKFLIVAKESYQNENPLSDEELAETTLLLKCLTMICRHFDNIQTVANYQYISCCVAISMNIIMVVSEFDYMFHTVEKEFDKNPFCVVYFSVYSFSRTNENQAHRKSSIYNHLVN